MEDRHRLQLAAALEPTTEDGRAYEVTLIRAGETLHGWLFPPQVLRDSVPLWEGVTSLVDHRRYMQHPSVRDVVGSIGKVRFEKGALLGEYRVLDSADWLTRMLDQIIADRKAGLPVPRVGLSADMLVKAHRKGERYIAEKIGRVLSVDVVFDPVAGGAFERVLNSVLATNRGGDEMGNRGDMAAVTDNEEAQVRWEEMERAQCGHLLRASLNASGLPTAMKEEIRSPYEGRIFTVEGLNQAIKGQERLLAKLVEDELTPPPG